MNVSIVPIGCQHIESFGDCVDEIARERRFLAIVEGFPSDQTAIWVTVNRARGNPHLVALDGERVVGWCEIRREVLPGRLHWAVLGVGVRAAYRGAGLGRQLMTAAIALAWASGLARIELWVRAPNAPAIALYRALGFAEEGRRRDAMRLDNTAEDEVLMALYAPGQQRKGA